eukprot:1615075-Rhodomonas_salina.1
MSVPDRQSRRVGRWHHTLGQYRTPRSRRVGRQQEETRLGSDARGSSSDLVAAYPRSVPDTA